MSALARFGTTAVSDALDTLGIDGGCVGLRAITPGARCAGPALTIRFEPVGEGGRGPAADYIDDVPPGAMIVLDNAGRQYCTVWGDILTACAAARGVAGTVIHGSCRDSAGIRALSYPLFALSAYMKSGKNRVRMVARDVPVTIGATTIHPGDVVVGDDDGIVVVPAARAADVEEIAASVVEMERRVLASVGEGMRLADARAANGYDRFSWKGTAS